MRSSERRGSKRVNNAVPVCLVLSEYGRMKVRVESRSFLDSSRSKP